MKPFDGNHAPVDELVPLAKGQVADRPRNQNLSSFCEITDPRREVHGCAVEGGFGLYRLTSAQTGLDLKTTPIFLGERRSLNRDCAVDGERWRCVEPWISVNMIALSPVS